MNIRQTLPATLIALAAFSHAATATPAPAAAPAPATKPAVAAPAATPAPAAAAPAVAPAPAAAATPVAAPVAPVAAPSKFASDTEKFSYAIGLDVGESLKRVDMPLDLAQVSKGMADMVGKDSTKILLTADERREVINQLMTMIQKAAAVKDSLASIENEKKAKAFLDKNKKAKGVITTKTGLQYSYITKGKGKISPKATDDVTAHYVGTLMDGSEFDSSVKRGQPATFGLANVIPGWQEMLPLMKVGDKVKCWIPANLGYGARGNAKIPANSMLIFEIELIAIPTAETAPAPAAAAPAPAAKPAVATPAATPAPATAAPATAPAAAPAPAAKPAK